MKQTRFGELSAVVTGGTDREGGGKGPIVVLMHGFGAPGTDLVPLWRVLDAPKDTRYVFPAAPHVLDFGFGDARAWWMIDMMALERAMRSGTPRVIADGVPEGLPEARGLMTAALADIAAKMGPAPMFLGGFSQGAMLAMDVALHTELPLAGVALLSGSLVARDEWIPRMPARRGLRIMQSHGVSDAVLPFSLAEELRDLLVAAGTAHRFVPFRGGHEIPPEVTDALGALLRGESPTSPA